MPNLPIECPYSACLDFTVTLQQYDLTASSAKAPQRIRARSIAMVICPQHERARRRVGPPASCTGEMGPRRRTARARAGAQLLNVAARHKYYAASVFLTQIFEGRYTDSVLLEVRRSSDNIAVVTVFCSFLPWDWFCCRGGRERRFLSAVAPTS